MERGGGKKVRERAGRERGAERQGTTKRAKKAEKGRRYRFNNGEKRRNTNKGSEGLRSRGERRRGVYFEVVSRAKTCLPRGTPGEGWSLES